MRFFNLPKMASIVVYGFLIAFTLEAVMIAVKEQSYMLSFITEVLLPLNEVNLDSSSNEFSNASIKSPPSHVITKKSSDREIYLVTCTHKEQILIPMFNNLTLI